MKHEERDVVVIGAGLAGSVAVLALARRGISVTVASRDGWHSLNPGKLTTAPLHGVEAAEAVLAHADRRAPVSDAR